MAEGGTDTRLRKQPSQLAPPPIVLLSLTLDRLYRFSKSRSLFTLRHEGPLMAAVAGSWSSYKLVVYDFGQRQLLQSSITPSFACGCGAWVIPDLDGLVVGDAGVDAGSGAHDGTAGVAAPSS